jgi:TolB-like protein/DNA-binding winged helix-turn-helix (wHTH) protein
MNTLPSERVRFGAFELDLSTGKLRSTETSHPNNKVLLREQVFQALRMLVERGGKIVTREEIKGRLWANDTTVDFDQSINATIKAPRRALGDSADNPRYIETLGRRGYRLMPTLKYLESAPASALEKDREQGEQSAAEVSPNAARIRRGSHWWKAVVVLAIVIFGGGGYISWRHFRSPALPRKIMLAVLPFKNLTGDPQKDYLADGLTEETISQLGRLNPEQLGVIARTSVMRYKPSDEGVDQIGRDLSVQYVLENSLRESGDHMRVTAQLIQVKDQTHLWSQDYDYPVKDILKIEDDLAQAVAHEIRVRLPSQQQPQLAQSHPPNPEAFDAYMQGYYFFEKDTNKDTEMAAKYYERATQMDPSYALAWVGLSRVRKWQANVDLIPTDEGYRLAREAVERALALDPNLAVAHAQLGRIKRQVDFDWAGGDASIQRAIALEAGHPEGIRLAASSAAVTFGRFDEALRLAHRAVDLDPLNADSWESLGEVEFWMGQLDKATRDFKKGFELSPDVWPVPNFLSQIYVMQGHAQDALPEIELVRYDAARTFLYAIAYYALGRKKESDAALSQLMTNHPTNQYQIAEVYAFRNQSDEAFEWLDRAYAQHNAGLIYTKVEPLLKSLHNDPRFAVFLKKLNLPT